MGYYVRILTPSAEPVSAATLRTALRPATRVSVKFSGQKDAWNSAFIGANPSPDTSPILSLERNQVRPRSLARAELQEFERELKTSLPRSGAKWVRDYLKSVRTIYAIQFHSHAGAHGALVTKVIEAMRRAAGGIVQADFNGFSNEAGDSVVWQFSEAARGEWTMAVLDEEAEWVSFKMELGDLAMREAFLRGEVPAGTKPRRAKRGGRAPHEKKVR